MKVSLSPELERFLNEQIRSGRYHSAEEAVGKAVELLKEMAEAESRLGALLQEAEESGPATEMTAQDWVDIENEGLKRLQSRWRRFSEIPSCETRPSAPNSGMLTGALAVQQRQTSQTYRSRFPGESPSALTTARLTGIGCS